MSGAGGDEVDVDVAAGDEVDVEHGRYTRGRMAECYHKACDVWDPDSRSPDSRRFLATVTQAVLESVLEMAEEENIQEDLIEEKLDEEDVMNKNATKEDVIKEEKEEMIEETTVQTAQSMEESSFLDRGSEVQAIVPRKAFSRDILGQQ